MRLLVLGAGYATRLYPLTRDRPKPLLPSHIETRIRRRPSGRPNPLSPLLRRGASAPRRACPKALADLTSKEGLIVSVPPRPQSDRL